MNPNMMNRNVSYYGVNRNRMNNCNNNHGSNCDNNCGSTRGNNCDNNCDNNRGNNCGNTRGNNCDTNCSNMPTTERNQDTNHGCMNRGNMMCNKYMEADRQQLECMNQQQLLSYLNQVSFSMYDATLFLDTHPCNQEAMAFFNDMQCARNHALKIYQKKFGPLLLDDVDADCEWTWGMQPLPWEPMC